MFEFVFSQIQIMSRFLEDHFADFDLTVQFRFVSMLKPVEMVCRVRQGLHKVLQN